MVDWPAFTAAIDSARSSFAFAFPLSVITWSPRTEGNLEPLEQPDWKAVRRAYDPQLRVALAVTR